MCVSGGFILGCVRYRKYLIHIIYQGVCLWKKQNREKQIRDGEAIIYVDLDSWRENKFCPANPQPQTCPLGRARVVSGISYFHDLKKLRKVTSINWPQVLSVFPHHSGGMERRYLTKTKKTQHPGCQGDPEVKPRQM